MDNEALEDLIDQWHHGAGGSQELHEFLGWTWREYAHWAETCQMPQRHS